MSEVVYDMTAVVPEVVTFFKNHPELPPIQEVWDVISEFIESKHLTASLSNIEFAFRAVRIEIDKALDAIPPNVWKEKVVIPEFKKHQKSQPKTASSKPLGVSTTQWLNSK